MEHLSNPQQEKLNQERDVFRQFLYNCIVRVQNNFFGESEIERNYKIKTFPDIDQENLLTASNSFSAGLLKLHSTSS